jgi:O-acetyl-ADP-ribose deacetylase (regulator of RNase III)
METTSPLDLGDYRLLVRLDEPFEAPEPAPEAEAERALVVEKLLAYLQSEATVEYGDESFKTIPSSYNEKRRVLRALLTVRGPDPLPSWFHAHMDRLLQREALECGLTDAASLPRVAQSERGSSYGASAACVLWRGDITRLRVDAIVNAANSAFLGCFEPFHACIDNVIHAAAGPRLREDCHAIIRRQGHHEGTGWAKVTRAYNLPSKYILHTVGPIVEGGEKQVSPEHEQRLSACYRSCLDLAYRVSDIRSVAFCCISTGVFGFPQERAASVALRTVARWLVAHPGALDLIVFNVFRQDDLEIYRRLLKGSKVQRL